jgi:hypothetical protein
MNEKDQINLREYIKNELSKGLTISQIETKAITQGGWTRQDVADVYKSLSSNILVSELESPAVSIGNKSKFWYLLLIPVLTWYVFAFQTIIFVAQQYLAETVTAVGFLLLFTFLLVRGIVRSASEHKPGKVISKIILLILISLAFWAVDTVFNSCFDCDTKRETFEPNSLPTIETRVDTDFTLQQGQAAILTDIGKMVRYNSYSSGAWGAGVGFAYTNSNPSYDNPNAKDYHVVILPDFSHDNITATFRVELPESTCERQELGTPSDVCWEDLAFKKSEPSYCLKVMWHNNRRDCFSSIAKNIYYKNGNHEERVLQARKVCVLDDTNELNMCTAIGKEKPLSQKECIALIGDPTTMTFNPGFYNECFAVASDTYPDIWDPKLCSSIQEPKIRGWCGMLPVKTL